MATAAATTQEDILLPYQQEAIRVVGSHQVTFWEKSRRIGASWGIAADAVLRSAATRDAGGMHSFYIGYNRDMTRGFIDDAAKWVRQFRLAAADVEEFVLKDQDENGGERDIQAFRIKFASGFELLALCSSPRSLRGKQGYVIIDEAAFHDDLDELLKAAFALLIWGGKLLVLSTHDGTDNAFNQRIADIRAGRQKHWGLIRTSFDDALHDGLFRRICLTSGRAWSQAAEDAWATEIREHYGDGASEELDCIPRQGGGKFLPRTLLESRVTDAPVLRWECDDTFVDKGDEERFRECDTWCTDYLGPVLKALTGRSAVGEDFGRSGDLTVLWPVLVQPDLRRVTPCVIELRNVPFRQQEQVLNYLIDHLPQCTGVALDARGNGQYLAEVTRQRYGSDRVAEVMLTEGWYREHMPPLKAALEDGTLTLPRDSDIVDDFHTLETVRGIARPPERSRKTPNGQRHSDAAVAAAMAWFAASDIESCRIDDLMVGGALLSNEAFGGALPRLDW